MKLPREDATPSVATIITGHFQERRNYSTWRSRGTPDYLLMLTLGGTGRIGYRTKAGKTGEQVVRTWQAVVIQPNCLHDYGTARGSEEWELLWTHFLPYPHWQEWLHWPEIAPETMGVGLLTLDESVQATVTDLLFEMHRRASGGLPRRESFAMNALENALLWCDTINPRSLRSRGDARVEKAIQYLREHLAEPVSLPQLAQAVGLSPSRLSHLFQEQTGQTPGQFLERERIARARQLLLFTSRTIASIAADVGFESPFYFTLRFRKQMGRSPRAFREQAEAQPTIE